MFIILVAIGISFALMVYRTKKRKQDNCSPDKKDDQENLGDVGDYLICGQAAINHDLDIKSQVRNLSLNYDREITKDKMHILEHLGSGNFGTVDKGELTMNDDTKITVAIKSMNMPTESEIVNFISEIKIMGYVPPHVNLVNMVGACTTELTSSRNMWLLLEYCSHGDLKTYLAKNRCLVISQNDGSNLLLWCDQISKGMQFLARNQIMHGDLAARNVLLDIDPLQPSLLIAKVADFGLSKKFYDNLKYEKKARELVPWKWMALEYMRSSYFTLNSDVWSFAVVVWEIFSLGRDPYGTKDYDEVLEQLENGYRLTCPKEIEVIKDWSPKNIYDKVSSICFLSDPLERADFSKVAEIFQEELSNLEIEHYNNLSVTEEKRFEKRYFNRVHTENSL